MKVGDFFVDLGVNATGATTLKDFIGSMGRMRMSTLGAIGALGTVGTYMLGVVDNASGVAVAFQKFTTQTGLSSQELQRWQIVAKQANVSATDVAGSVTNLQDALAAIHIGQGNVAPFQVLTVSPLGDAFDVLKRLRARMKEVDPAQFRRQIAGMGLAPSMMNVLGLSDSDFENFAKSGRGMTPGQQADILATTEKFNALLVKIQEINYELAGMATGPLSGLIDVLQKTVKQRNFTEGAATFLDKMFGTNLTPFMKDVNNRQMAHKDQVRLYNIRVAADGANAPSFKEFVKDLETALNDTEAQMPASEDQAGEYTIPGKKK